MLKKINKKYSELNVYVKNIIGIFISSLSGFCLSIVLSLIFSYILSKSYVIPDYIILFFIISVLIGAFLNGYIGNKLLKYNGLFSGLICSVLYTGLIILLMIFLSDLNLSVNSIILFIFVILFSVTGGIVSANIKRRK